jgi:2,3-bisphosphoglycerate-independent phosphoglycerate mutase
MVVMDGVGHGAHDEGDAVWLARTPTLDRLEQTALRSSIRAHGKAVGLPSDKDMGNSEVGHNAFGAGRVFDQGAKLVDQAIASRAIFNGAVWQETVREGTLHFVGLLSDGNVHSHEKHLHAMLREAHRSGVARVRVHILLDGRDVPETSALTYVERLEAVLSELSSDYRIASGGGRMITTMDRYEADWKIVERGWRAHVHAQARQFPSATEAIQTFRDETPGLSDQYLPPFVVSPAEPMQDGDGVILFNFRGDRAIEISRAFDEGESFSGFDRGHRPKVRYAGMMQYDGDLQLPKRFLVTPPAIDQTFGEYLVRNGVRQWAGSETQKYGHVTYFWNGNRSGYIDEACEQYVEIHSDNVPFDQRPEMKAPEITDAVIEAIRSGDFGFIRLNFANGDMVGHTGNLPATILAVEAVDHALERLSKAVRDVGGVLIVTADHGNADEMYLRDKKGGGFLMTGGGEHQPRTSHSLNAVPFLVEGAPAGAALRPGGGLSNVAATVMELLGLQPPDDYDRSLLSTTGD